MRVSTNLIHDRGIERIIEGQSSLFDTQQRLASGRRILTPADDPVAASRALDTAQSRAINAGYGSNQALARDALGLVDSTLTNVGDVLHTARTLMVQGGNGALTDADRASIAGELRAHFEQLLGLANARDGAGGYLFSGYAATTQPFAATTTGAQFNGDEGQRQLQVGATRTVAVSESGAAIFERIRTGNGTFATAQSAGNTGDGVISVGSVVNAAAVTGNAYQIVFDVTAGVTTYDIVNTTAGTTLSAGNAYTSGTAITFAGMQVEVTGAPADNDTFVVAPSTNQSVFTTLVNAVNTLTRPTATAAERARLAQGIAEALANIDQAQERALAVHTGVGARMRELDSLGDLQQGVDLHYTKRLSELQDLDYAKAASDLIRQQQSLDAARASFQRVTQLSLFDFL